MKIYIAGIFRNKDIPEISAILEKLGHGTEPHWWTADSKELEPDFNPIEWLQIPKVQKWFRRDVKAARECKLFILVFSCYGTLRGALVELGIAYESKKEFPKRVVAFDRIGVIGRSTLFNCFDEIYYNFKDLIEGEGLQSSGGRHLTNVGS